MDPRLRAKSDLYVFGGYVLLGLAVLLNPLTISWYQAWGYLPQVPAHHLHANDIRYLLPALLDILCLANGAIMVFSPRRLRYFLNDSFAFNLFMFLLLLATMFSLNVIHPGKFKGLRIMYMLVLMFFLTNTLYQAVVKKRDSEELHPFYRNMAVTLYGIGMVLLLLEGIFMFHTGTHRFNGTLGSRAWFLKNWELNAEGYRDAAYDSTALEGKRKVLVIGDSFVAGHGVKDPKDRFSDLLGTKLPANLYHVFNLGVGGSDTRDENKRLRAFPYKPDMLVFSWYPNDIELDGELAGFILQHARSYHDIWGPTRYFVRRSFLWNYLYWRFPHPDELSDYFGYIKQCFAYLKVRNMHLLQIDKLIAYGDSLQVPMAAVVFPFLENAEGSAFATDIIEERFRKRGVPVVSVRQMILGQPAIDYIVNQNDPHPNERLHAMVADSLYQAFERRGAISTEPLLPRAVAKIPSADTLKVDSVKRPAAPKPKAKPKTGQKTGGTDKPKASEPKPSDTPPTDAKVVDPKATEPKPGDASTGEPKPAPAKPRKKPTPKPKPKPSTSGLDR
ncbi:MAG TPA: SGNH/GDSL hydrolase family protein [Bacteroidia bacterium]|nr:SGNH/GDSL hydrolase family protein [Bacteroidia bacterium]